MNVAVIDLGTNTFHLLIVKVKIDGSYTKLYKTKTSVKLGKGGINNDIILPESFERGLKTLIDYKKIIDHLHVKNVFAFGTSAIRSATNGVEFIEEVRDQTGIHIKAISGDEEAQYICFGVREALKLPETSLIMDIGGGSLEFIIADDANLFWKKSFNMGVARLLEKFQPSEPITNQEIKRIEKYLEEELKELFNSFSKYNITTLVGASGSFDTFAEMIYYKFPDSPDYRDERTEYTFDLSYFNNIHDQLINSTMEERKNTRGIISMRVDMIVLSSILVNFIIKKLDISQMRLSTYSLKEGVLAKIIEDSGILS